MAGSFTDDNGIGIEDKAPARLDLVWDTAGISVFVTLFQEGLLLEGQSGATIREVLCRRHGLSDDYLDGRVNTIFLDGKAVDNVDSARIHQGCTLALSASMPGLAGAVLRKAGFFSGMRNTITHSPDAPSAPGKEVLFTLKLFNMLLGQVGPLFLASGVIIGSDRLTAFMLERTEAFWKGCRGILLDGVQLTEGEFVPRLRHDQEGLIRLRVVGRS